MTRDDDAPAPSTTSRRQLLAGVGSAGLTLAVPGASLAGTPAAAPLERGPLLRSLLERNHGLRPEYGGGFSNHQSMGLYSLAALGGSDAQLTAFADAHWSALEALPKEPGPSISRDDWKKWLGKREALNGFRAFFTAELRRSGRAATLRSYLPELLPGVAAGAFHPLIRTAYGVRFQDDQEVAEGLAYWATAYFPLGALGPAGKERDPRVLLAQVHANPSLAGLQLPGRMITGPMQSAAALPAFAGAVDALAPGDGTLRGIAAAALRLYLLGGDFTALHAVTGTHAFRLLSPHLPQPEQSVRYFWQAIAAVYVSLGAPSLPEPPATAPAWELSLRKVVTSTDAHDLKLVDIAREEETFYKDALYRRAAGRRMQLL
jgi:hypothetical protein